MATYKLIQDIEAEDHILGPLTLRQFIFALVAVFCFYICFIALTKHLAFLLIPFLPPGLFCAFFAVPFGRDQPTEVWALAKLRFLFKPRKRIWDQSGIKELVTITAPKRIEPVLTNGLSQNEVESRLKALANTIDSRGWAVKNVNVNAYSQPDPVATSNSDRLININDIPQEVPSYDVQASDDILDEANNPIAQQFEYMINESSQSHRQQLVNELNDVRSQQQTPPTGEPANYWFMQQPAVAQLPADQTMFANTQMVQPASTTAGSVPATQVSDIPDDPTLTAQLKARSNAQQNPYGHLRTLQPLSATATDTSQAAVNSSVQVADQQAANNRVQAASPAAPDPAILSLANNNDLNVATLAREAHKAKDDDQPPQNEVVISLH